MPKDEKSQPRPAYYYQFRRGVLKFDENGLPHSSNPSLEHDAKMHKKYIEGATPLTNLYQYLTNTRTRPDIDKRPDFMNASSEWKAFREEFLRKGDIPQLTSGIREQLKAEIAKYKVQQYWIIRNGILYRKGVQKFTSSTRAMYKATIVKQLIVDDEDKSDNSTSLKTIDALDHTTPLEAVITSSSLKRPAYTVENTHAPLHVSDDDDSESKPLSQSRSSEKVSNNYRNASHRGNIAFDKGIPYYKLEHLNKPEYKADYDKYIAGQTPLTVLYHYLQSCFKRSVTPKATTFASVKEHWKLYFATCVVSQKWLPIPAPVLDEIKAEIEPYKQYWTLSPEGLLRNTLNSIHRTKDRAFKPVEVPKSKGLRKFAASIIEESKAKRARIDTSETVALAPIAPSPTSTMPGPGDGAKLIARPPVRYVPWIFKPLISSSHTIHSATFFAAARMPLPLPSTGLPIVSYPSQEDALIDAATPDAVDAAPSAPTTDTTPDTAPFAAPMQPDVAPDVDAVPASSYAIRM